MELVNTNDENSFDPTPRLKSSPIPIKFLSFNYKDKKCFNCGEEYIETLLCIWQKYCKKCLSRYINDITDNNNTYLDVYIYTMDLECSNHEISRTIVPRNIQECCGNCVRILCFKQMVGGIIGRNICDLDKNICDKVVESENYCKLCGKTRNSAKPINWTPYSQFKDVKEMTKGGYGVIHKATWLSNNETVILKRFENSKNSSNYFLNELKSYRHCIDKSLYSHIIKIYGFTRDPESEDYILVIKYASEGDLHKYLQKSFKNITWNNQKLRILWQISEGLSSQNLSSKIQTCSASFDSNYISADLELDIDTERYKSKKKWYVISFKKYLKKRSSRCECNSVLEKSYVSQLEIALNNVHMAIEEYELLILMKRKSNCEFHGYRSQTRTEAREKLNRLFPKDMEVFKIVLDKLFIALNLNLKIYDFFKRC
ncbi:hypothetical protein RhiirB3_381332 [Rhizophagus irregularis]|nr:hypothetical protein RhiirB3_510822 [Rhizophagus irregularis]PKY15923.1 hypothetical protein RhiirB3_381332 [Rhizophagus irregularis]